MTEEKLVKVTSESQLYSGAMVRLVKCRHCNGSHQWMLLKKDSPRFWTPGPCGRGPAKEMGLKLIAFELAIADGRLFLVDVGLKQEANVYKKKLVVVE